MKEKDYRNRALIATLWVVGGYGLAQVLRLGGNLILTRLLVPELFGLMAIAQVFLLGLGLLSDIGLGPGIIRSKRSSDSMFVNTAWTLQVIRGGLSWLVIIAIAVPVSRVYETPLLVWILPVSGLATLISSFTSTAVFTLNKEVKLGKITAMELVSQFAGLLAMVIVGYLYRNVWALVVGAIVTALVTVCWSHFLELEIHNRFALEKDAFRELISFGKWVLVSTAMMFLATQSDRLLLGKFFPLALFGVYNIAVIFAELPKQVLNQLSNRVIFPIMANYSDLPRQEFRTKILRKRKLILLPLALLISIFISFGDLIISSLYDVRYHQAGWMLSLLALGMWPFVLNASIDRCFFAIGSPKIPATGNFFKFLYMIIFVPVLFNYGGIFGGVLAVAMNDLPVYLVNCYGLKKENLTCFLQDILTSMCLVVLVVIFVMIRLAYDMGAPCKFLLGG